MFLHCKFVKNFNFLIINKKLKLFRNSIILILNIILNVYLYTFKYMKVFLYSIIPNFWLNFWNLCKFVQNLHVNFP